MYVYSPTLDLTRLYFYTFSPNVAEVVGVDGVAVVVKGVAAVVGVSGHVLEVA